MTATNHNAFNDRSPSRQRLVEAIHQLPDGLVQELAGFADYLLYRENQAVQQKEPTYPPLPDGKSEGYRKFKASGLIGFGEAETDLSETYKVRYAQEIAQRHDHR